MPLALAATLLIGGATTAAAQTAPSPSTTTTTTTTTSPAVPTPAPPTPTPTPPAPGHIQPAAQPIPDQYIVQLKGVAPGSVPATANYLATKHGGGVLSVYQHALQGFAVQMSAGQAAALSEEPDVASVSENGVVHVATQQPPTPNAAPDWGDDRIDQHTPPLDNVYTYDSSGSGVHAYIIDTGIQGNVADFGGRVAFGVDEVGGEPQLFDCEGHGTHVAGELGGTDWGVAKSVNLVEVRVLDCSGSGTDLQVMNGVEWVTAHAIQPAVANMSLGGSLD
ncbi:MAG TPA: S8 family serine peptidase, partial [Acidimicrobiia bacterium]|nr:S8 family serine peptidase [Acidimicrobiia bacterium]